MSAHVTTITCASILLHVFPKVAREREGYSLPSLLLICELLNQARAWFHVGMCVCVCVCVCMCVCVSAPQAIKNHSHEMKPE